MADIDHFKRINDAFGHAAGDAVLVEFAERLRRGLRGDDIACRYGGEEFVVLMDGAEEDAARGIAERLRASIAAEPFDIPESRLDVTVSIGVASLAPGEDAGRLLRRADMALYEAKRAGRNRAVCAPVAIDSLNHR